MGVSRREIIFLYAVKDGNPNGDPADENRPRYDEVTETVFVSDARIKRTIRDHLLREGKPVLITKNTKFLGGKIEVGGKEIKRENLFEFIDVRLFGLVPAGKEEGRGTLFNLYGPVQFRFGHSLNSTEIKFLKGSSTPIRGKKGEKEEETGKFTEKYYVPFVVIATYGVVNELVAEEQNIPLTEEDIEEMLRALWKGTEELQSSSKAVHIPLLLMTIKYKKGKERLIGNLDDFIVLKDKEGRDISYRGEREKGKEIRKITDFKLDLSNLIRLLKKHTEDIEIISVLKHPELETSGLNETGELKLEVTG